MQFVDTRKGKVNWEGYDEIDITYTIEGKYITAERKERERDIASGKTDVVIGTHSVFSKTVKFKNLSFVVIDEQHKFGVAQKYDLQEKGAGVDTLTLTATPIPRSVLMLLYDELQLSEIDKSHKTKVKTFLVPDYKKDGMFSYVRDEAKKGTLKRYIQRGNCVVLQPFNPAYHEMVIRGEDLNHLHIAGRVVETKAKW